MASPPKPWERAGATGATTGTLSPLIRPQVSLRDSAIRRNMLALWLTVLSSSSSSRTHGDYDWRVSPGNVKCYHRTIYNTDHTTSARLPVRCCQPERLSL